MKLETLASQLRGQGHTCVIDNPFSWCQNETHCLSKTKQPKFDFENMSGQELAQYREKKNQLVEQLAQNYHECVFLEEAVPDPAATESDRGRGQLGRVLDFRFCGNIAHCTGYDKINASEFLYRN